MSGVTKTQTARKDGKPNTTGTGFGQMSRQEMSGLYQLSFLLTRDHEKAERCFVAGVEDFAQANPGFKEWAHSWATRLIIQNAIRELKPDPRQPASSLSRTVPYVSELSSSPRGCFKVETILALEDFERFVFVLSVLEHYSEHDCARLLERSVLEVREARVQALEHLMKIQST